MPQRSGLKDTIRAIITTTKSSNKAKSRKGNCLMKVTPGSGSHYKESTGGKSKGFKKGNAKNENDMGRIGEDQSFTPSKRRR